MENEAKILYQSPNSESIFYTPELLQTSQSLANKIDIPDYNEKNTKSQATLGHSTVEQDVQENINTKRHRI